MDPKVLQGQELEHKEAVALDNPTEPERPGLRVYLAASGPVLGWIAQMEIQTLAATVLAVINAELGPITNYPWIYVSWLACIAVLSGVLGSFSDVLGRRWFFIVGNVFALIGAIICAATHSANVVIVGMTFAGVGAANQYLALAALSEMFPKKHRAYVQAILQMSPFPFTACGALIASKMAIDTWRWVYYLNIILSGLALIAVVLFYYPPVPYAEVSRWKLIKSHDWFGAGLLVLGVMGLYLGAGPAAFGLHGWGTAAVLVPICVGIAILIAMGFWNGHASNPLLPTKMFNNVRGVNLLLFSIGAITMPLEVVTFVWSSQTQAIYTTDATKIGLYNFPTGFGAEVGFLIAALTIKRGRTNLQLAVACLILAIFVGLQATLTPNGIRPGLAYLSIGGVALGFIQVIVVVMIQFGIGNEHIGAVTGLFILVRWIGAAIGIALALTIIRSKVGSTWPMAVAEAVFPLGLPQTSLPLLLGALATGSPAAVMQVPGITPAIVEAATVVTKEVYAAAYRLIYYPSLALGLFAVVVSAFTADIAPLMESDEALPMGIPRFLMLAASRRDAEKGSGINEEKN